MKQLIADNYFGIFKIAHAMQDIMQITPLKVRKNNSNHQLKINLTDITVSQVKFLSA